MATLTLKTPQIQKSMIPQKDGWYTVTPQMAEAWEETGLNVRNLSAGILNQYARDMKNRHWQVNGEPMQFDEDGRLINGFHRCRACAIAQTPFDTYVITGLPRDTKTFDLGYKRTHGQILKISGEHYGNFLAATARLLWKYERGPRYLLDNRMRPTLHDVFDLIEANPKLIESVELCCGSFAKAGRLCSSSSIPSFMHYVGSKNHGDKATDFIELVHKGADPQNGPNKPAFLLRERMQDWQRQRVKASQAQWLGLWIPAWNAYVQGKPLQKLYSLDWSGEAPGSRIA